MSSYEFIFRSIVDVPKTELEQFQCTEEDLRSFLMEDATEFDRANISKTTVVSLSGGGDVVAFFSLSADAVQLSEGEAFHLSLPFKAPTSYFPAVKITKLAVATQHQGNGLGCELINYIMGLAFALSQAAAVRLLTVDALNKPEVIRFYERNGFVECAQDARMRREQKSKRTIPMYKDMYA